MLRSSYRERFDAFSGISAKNKTRNKELLPRKDEKLRAIVSLVRVGSILGTTDPNPLSPHA
jgi:hypothetical protein